MTRTIFGSNIYRVEIFAISEYRDVIITSSLRNWVMECYIEPITARLLLGWRLILIFYWLVTIGLGHLCLSSTIT